MLCYSKCIYGLGKVSLKKALDTRRELVNFFSNLIFRLPAIQTLSFKMMTHNRNALIGLISRKLKSKSCQLHNVNKTETSPQHSYHFLSLSEFFSFPSKILKDIKDFVNFSPYYACYCMATDTDRLSSNLIG